MAGLAAPFPTGADLLVWWRDEGDDLLALVGPQRYLQRLAELLSRASPRDVEAMGIGCGRRIDRPCRDPRTCGQDPADAPTGATRDRTGPVPSACTGFKDCWSAYGIDVEFTADGRHCAVHFQDPSDRSRTDVQVNGVRVAESLRLDSSGYWVGRRNYVVQAEGPPDHPEQGLTMGNLCCAILSLVVHDAELVTTRILVPEAAETWTDPELRLDRDTLHVYPNGQAREAGRADRVLPVEPSPSY
ncbi:hypothetical protein OG618_01010 [Kitasatospora sp. NBC_01246]|uniref:hypothetical protein n=1 Tax=Kitasatospora sp. NBC_01246 TaxID=2903570 RepID=UPI002E3310E4|nr:hypothetical protein [Kitasatospora sp. NBC_01246]